MKIAYVYYVVTVEPALNLFHPHVIINHLQQLEVGHRHQHHGHVLLHPSYTRNWVFTIIGRNELSCLMIM